MSIPLSCSLNEENKLLCAPVTQLEKLRIKDILIDISKTNPFEGVLLNCFECLLEIEILDFQKAFMELKLRCSSDETQYSSIKYQKGLFIVDCTRSGESGGCLQSEEAYSLGIKPRRVKIHAFVDSCSLEVFINNGDICFSHRIFPSIKSKFIKFVSNAEICLLDAKIYKLSSIW